VNPVAATVLGVAGAIVGIPVAAVSYGASVTGRVQLPQRWWTGAPARPTVVATTSIASGFAAAVPGAVLPINPALVAFWMFAVIGVSLAVIDVRRRRLPHLLTGTLWVASLFCFAAAVITGADPTTLLRASGAGVLAVALLFAVAVALPGQLGLGDIAFAGAVTFTLGWLSWPAAAFGLALGFGVQAVGVLLGQPRRTDASFPMGPALLTGWLAAVALVAALP
jgi:leader peptidase (prepilin peptidase)/N-methyltransferase